MPMMIQASVKARPGALPLVGGDLQRLPFPDGTFDGALTVHILHLVERWRLVLDELRRVLVPKTGVLLLGGEQGGRSALVDFYFERARARKVLSHSLGTPGLTQALTYLRRDTNAHLTMLSLPYLKWQRTMPVSETLDALDRRTFSQMWNIPDDVHRPPPRDNRLRPAHPRRPGRHRRSWKPASSSTPPAGLRRLECLEA